MNPVIEQMFAFVAQTTEGEGIVSVWTPGGHMPLVGADMDRVDSLRPSAQMIADSFQQNVVLIRFSGRTDLETIKPRPDPRSN